MEYADRGSLSDALRAGRFPTHDYTAIYRCLLDIASGEPLPCMRHTISPSCIRNSWTLPLVSPCMQRIQPQRVPFRMQTCTFCCRLTLGTGLRCVL